MDRLFLKPKEAAELIGVVRTLFHQLVKGGVIPSCRVGKTIRIPVAALKAWAEAQVERPSTAAASRRSDENPFATSPLASPPFFMRRAGITVTL
ncbi:MAG: helix-turn-helix domain-containing protein [Bryobacteraceae bacterium]|nr:helix-turn-helix domain-containing protein [Bryobacteraceae bacterium]